MTFESSRMKARKLKRVEERQEERRKRRRTQSGRKRDSSETTGGEPRGRRSTSEKGSSVSIRPEFGLGGPSEIR